MCRGRLSVSKARENLRISNRWRCNLHLDKRGRDDTLAAREVMRGTGLKKALIFEMLGTKMDHD
jgi:hypothetical protein